MNHPHLKEHRKSSGWLDKQTWGLNVTKTVLTASHEILTYLNQPRTQRKKNKDSKKTRKNVLCSDPDSNLLAQAVKKNSDLSVNVLTSLKQEDCGLQCSTPELRASQHSHRLHKQNPTDMHSSRHAVVRLSNEKSRRASLFWCDSSGVSAGDWRAAAPALPASLSFRLYPENTPATTRVLEILLGETAGWLWEPVNKEVQCPWITLFTTCRSATLC